MKNKPKDTNAGGFDLIGDIHGEADRLKSLLQKMGYRPDAGAWRNPAGRRAIFVGDLIDRGPKVIETLELVRAMVDAGSALMVLGNHEFNLLCYMTPDGKGGFLRPNTEHNRKTCAATLREFEGREPELAGYLEWFRTLPLYLDLGGCRVVHAEWNSELVAGVNGRTYLDDGFLRLASTKKTEANRTIEILLKGSEMVLPNEMTFLDHESHERNEVRICWPVPGVGRSLREITFQDDGEMPNIPVPPEIAGKITGYGAEEPPVFFGHYAVKTRANGLFAPNAACLDYGCGKGGRLGAYRWSGEQTLVEENFLSA